MFEMATGEEDQKLWNVVSRRDTDSHWGREFPMLHNAQCAIATPSSIKAWKLSETCNEGLLEAMWLLIDSICQAERFEHL